MARRRRRRPQGDVELNLAAMLDMAFQLLAFFILTFKPAPLETHIALRLPPPQPVTGPLVEQPAGADTIDDTAVAGLETLVVTALSNPAGEISALRVGEGEPTTSLRVLEERLKTIFADPGMPFEQLILQIGSNLRYDQLMGLVDICSHITLASGKPLSGMSFVELPDETTPQ